MFVGYLAYPWDALGVGSIVDDHADGIDRRGLSAEDAESLTRPLAPSKRWLLSSHRLDLALAMSVCGCWTGMYTLSSRIKGFAFGEDMSLDQQNSLVERETQGLLSLPGRITAADLSHFDELIRKGCIIAILAWANRMATVAADFRPVLGQIDVLCKTLNLRGLRTLAETLRDNAGAGVQDSGLL